MKIGKKFFYFVFYIFYFLYYFLFFTVFWIIGLFDFYGVNWDLNGVLLGNNGKRLLLSDRAKRSKLRGISKNCASVRNEQEVDGDSKNHEVCGSTCGGLRIIGVAGACV